MDSPGLLETTPVHDTTAATPETLAGMLADLAVRNGATSLALACCEGSDLGHAVYRLRGSVRRDDERHPDLARSLAQAFSRSGESVRFETPGNVTIRAMRIEWDGERGSLVAHVLPRTILDGFGA